LQALGGRGFEGEVGVHLSALQLWQKPCDEPLASYLERFQRAPGYSQFARATIDTAMRTGCALDIEPLLGVAPAFQDSVATYWALSEGGSPRQLAWDLRDAIGAAVEQTLVMRDRPVESFDVLQRMIAMALGLPKAGCPLRRKAAVPKRASVVPLARVARFYAVLDEESGPVSHGFLRGRLAALVADSCPGIRVVLGHDAANAGTWQIALADEDDNRATVFELAPAKNASIVDAIMLAEHVRSADQTDALRTLARSDLDPYARTLLVRRLRMMGAPWIEDSSYFSGGDAQLQVEAYLWHATTDRRKALLSALARLSDPTALFLPQVLGLLATTAEERELVAARVQTGVSDQRRRTALLTMFGSRAAVVALLTSPEAVVRATAVDHLDFRDDIEAIAGEVGPKLKMPAFFSGSLSGKAAWDALRVEIAATPDWALPERAKLILDLDNTLSSGMRIWIDREVKRRTEGFAAGGRAPDPAG
jgi:hypothetical protein